ncbi:MAG: hypothetical protein KF881_11255 [Acidobacteria bacterium]|nr:hypothetical protein [Acidobacteriota bacterium]
MRYRSLIIVLLVLLFSGAAVNGQQYKSWWFFGSKALAERKVIPMSELSACLLGEDSPRNIRDKFKRVVDGGVSRQPGLLYRKMCDVALILNLLPEQDKALPQDYPGYAIFKISGDNLELYHYPVDVKYVGVANRKFASAETLLKKDLKACGTPALQRLFAPVNSIWKEGWSTWQAPIADLKAENNPIAYDARDIWIMSVEDYKVYVKRVGAKHPVFDVSPESDEIKRQR